MSGRTAAALYTIPCLLLLLSPTYAANCPKSGPPSNVQWRFTTSFPSGCNGTTCSYFVGVGTNEDPAFLDFVIEGNSRGWIAVGYSPNQGMPDADVFVCAVIEGNVTVLDTYDIPDDRQNEVDLSQDLCPFATSFVNGRIRCVFSRAIKTNDVLQDKVLNQTYFQLSGWTNALGSSRSALVSHGTSTPMVSSSKVNPATAVSAISIGIDPLIRAHGILMVVAWPIMAVMGIFFAAWMKPVLPKTKWFQAHRAILLASLFFGCVAFLFGFVAKRNSQGLVSFFDPTTTAHFAIGIIVMALHILNPIISAFRCLPTHPRRWIFNLVHATCIGLGVEILALINVGIGLALFGDKLSLTTVAPPLAVYLAYVVFLVILIGTLFIIFTIIAVKTGSPQLAPSMLKPLLGHLTSSSPVPNKTDVMMSITTDNKSDSPAKSQPDDQTSSSNTCDDQTKPSEHPINPSDAQKATKPSSQDATLRWLGFTAFLAVMVPLMLVVIILIAAM